MIQPIQTTNKPEHMPADVYVPEKPPEKILALIRRMEEGYYASQNIIGMNGKDIIKLFPHRVKGGPFHIRIANRVYKAAQETWLKEGCIAINQVQLEEIEPAINADDTVILTPFEPDVMNYRLADKIVFSFSPRERYSEEELKEADLVLIDSQKLKQIASSHFKHLFFRQGQRAHLEYNGASFVLTCISSESKLEPPTDDYFEYIHDKTNIVFEETVWNPYCIIEKKKSDIPLTFHFLLDILNVEKYPSKNRPILYDEHELTKQLQKRFSGQLMISGRKCDFAIAPDVKIRAKLEYIEPVHKDVPLQELPGVYTPAYKIERDSKFIFSVKNPAIHPIKGPPSPAKSVTFRVRAVTPTLGYDGISEKTHNWVDARELQEAAKKQLPIFCAETEAFITHNGMRYKLFVVGCNEEDFTKKTETALKHYIISDKTHVEFEAFKSIPQEFINDTKTYPLESIELELRQNSSNRSTDRIVASREEVIDTMIKTTPVEKCKKQTFDIELKSGQRFEATVKTMAYKDKKINGGIYTKLGKIVSDTKINLSVARRSLIQLVSEPKVITFKNADPRQSLEEIGLTGLNDEIIEAVEMLVYPLGELREWAKKIGVKPPKGFLLYGPPGTGKTTFAHGIAKLLGIPKEHVAEISPKDIHSKWVGDSEKNLHKLFEPAIEAAKTEEGKNERFLIFIDEIESLCANRQTETSSYKKDLVGALLTEMDGFARLENVLVIGTTNDFKRIDPAFLRPGRFTNLLEFSLPDEAGRLKILEYHTKSMRDDGTIQKDLDLKWYAKNTEGFSGDHLKGLVQSAGRYNLRRLAKSKISASEVESDPNSLVSKEDFDLALARLRKSLDDEEGKPDITMYI